MREWVEQLGRAFGWQGRVVLVPPDLTVPGAAAPAVTLRLVLVVLALGVVVLLPSLVYLFRVFKAGPSHSARRLPHGGPRS